MSVQKTCGMKKGGRERWRRRNKERRETASQSVVVMVDLETVGAPWPSTALPTLPTTTGNHQITDTTTTNTSFVRFQVGKRFKKKSLNPLNIFLLCCASVAQSAVA